MPENGHVQKFVRLRSTTGEWIAPPELRPLLTADAAKLGSNLTEAVVTILAGIYDVPFEPAGRRTTPKENAEELNLRFPVNLKNAIGRRALVADVSFQTQILLDLCRHYELTIPPALERRLAAA